MNNEQNIQAAQQRLKALLQQLDLREQALREHQQRDERNQPDPRPEAEAIRLGIEQRGYAVPGPGRVSLFKLRVEIPGVSASDHINNTLQNPALSESDWSTGTALETNTRISGVKAISGTRKASVTSPPEHPIGTRDNAPPSSKNLITYSTGHFFLAHGLRQIHLGGLTADNREEAYNGLILALICDFGQVVELKELCVQKGADFASLVEC
ncbi:hypothetical protein SARC_03816 [Sphaeroforma arctica JP610]|uniref:Uncharacterized protein n=1 Tax=Sphaeroforma arctica JP610 TaxID=667725 RepID=A0A0L0G4C7_9EUKA|nr:hypothetical protein SARC_03816 [Sphaeroforma arctica JP610]KNC83952.1 hypothetical protein SARC_03816 [Sphaeroforma arctica JP610]|eukprot:XP_014157854.1 hypothetical protein SARC_03816 [Sphaeroforma arctica JP610]